MTQPALEQEHLAGDRFSVALIPYTLDHTIAGSYVPGTLVNLEVS